MQRTSHITQGKDKKEILDELKQLALSRDGTCLSVVYMNSKTKLTWRCKKGHIWDAIPSNVIKGHWCKICGNERQGRKKVSNIQRMREVARFKHGECLSIQYKNNSTKLRWRCSRGHEWEAVPSSIIGTKKNNGTWCPICLGKVPKDVMLKKFRNFAKEKGGQLLSGQYINAKTKLRWRCSNGHEWEAVPDSVRRNTWCPICRRSSPPILSLEELTITAKKFGGKCLAIEYINSSIPIKWECSEGHQWEAKPSHVRAGHWCPICSSGISERICRAILEYITGVRFPKQRPNWLLNDRGNQMELDGYAESIKVAFEYQGKQHFEHVNFFHRGKKTLESQRKDDRRKKELCKQNGIKLIEVSYDIPYAGLQAYLSDAINKISPEIIYNKLSIDIEKLGVRNINKLADIQAFVTSKGGMCLSNHYINNKTKLRWRCKNGHEWDAVPASIRTGTWCPICGDARGGAKRAHGIEYMHKLANQHGGKCLSQSYKNSKTIIRWQCVKGHEWRTQASVVISGHWCPKCGKEKIGKQFSLTIEQIQETAKLMGGKCLSTVYTNSRTKLLWQCAKGHKWKAVANSIRRGSWCPVCIGRKSKLIQNPL